MAIKNLLVHLAPDDHWSGRLDAALDLARELDAHLTTLYVALPVHTPTGVEGRGASAAFLAEAGESARKKAEETKHEVTSRCEKAGVRWEWAYGDSDHLEDLLHVVHHTDLTIVSQMLPHGLEDRLMLQLPEKLVIGAGGPVLVLPRDMQGFRFAATSHAMIAWSYSREAIRALRDALPILKTMQKVSLLICSGEKPAAETRDAPVLAYLKRHGINAVALDRPLDGHAGEEILAAAAEISADLIVMGAYGHFGLIDKLVGTASRHVISNTPLPILMSH